MSTNTTPTVPSTLAEVLNELGASPRQTARVTNLVEQAHREAAQLQDMATKLVAMLSNEDGEHQLNTIRYEATHAGYSNSIHTASAEITSLLGQIQGAVMTVAS